MAVHWLGLSRDYGNPPSPVLWQCGMVSCIAEELRLCWAEVYGEVVEIVKVCVRLFRTRIKMSI